ncbi:Glutamate 5-kinase OS=Lysinibacillus sphaericus OX=1421 GN=proB PE=3 SV=1 [Lysinibacillus sphaericus]
MLPIINENDTVSVSELTFGDNDMLSALVSGLVHADQLIILTDINGLYDANPNKNPQAKRIDWLTEVTDEMLGFADGAGSGTGGMESDFSTCSFKCRRQSIYRDGLRGSKANRYFRWARRWDICKHEALAVLTNNKQWIALTEISGKIFIDNGAEHALLENGKSLLPAGVYRVEGDFEQGDVVEVYSHNKLIGRGEVLYSSLELAHAMGKRTDELTNYPIEVIHRDKWLKIQTK